MTDRVCAHVGGCDRRTCLKTPVTAVGTEVTLEMAFDLFLFFFSFGLTYSSIETGIKRTSAVDNLSYSCVMM